MNRVFTTFMENEKGKLERALEILDGIGQEMSELDMRQIKGPQKDPEPGDILVGELPVDLCRLLALHRKAGKARRKLHEEIGEMVGGLEGMERILSLTEQELESRYPRISDMRYRYTEMVEREQALWGLLKGSIEKEFSEALRNTAVPKGCAGFTMAFCRGWRFFLRPLKQEDLMKEADDLTRDLQSMVEHLERAEKAQDHGDQSGLHGHNGQDRSPQGQPSGIPGMPQGC